MVAQEASLEELANSDQRRLLTHNQSLVGRFRRISVVSWEISAPTSSLGIWRFFTSRLVGGFRRGYVAPASILDIDGAGVSADLRGQIFKVAGYSARWEVEPRGVVEAAESGFGGV